MKTRPMSRPKYPIHPRSKLIPNHPSNYVRGKRVIRRVTVSIVDDTIVRFSDLYKVFTTTDLGYGKFEITYLGENLTLDSAITLANSLMTTPINAGQIEWLTEDGTIEWGWVGEEKPFETGGIIIHIARMEYDDVMGLMSPV